MERVEKLKEYLQANPADPFLRHALALEYVKAGRANDAVQEFTTILLADPAYTGSYYHLGKALEQLGRDEEAAEWYAKGMQACQAAGDSHAYGELRGAFEQLTF